MTPTSGIILFTLIWWLVLFVVLPFGTRPRDSDQRTEGGWRGVPERPLLWRKVLATTAVTIVLWLGAFALVESGVFSFYDGGWPISASPTN